MKKGVVLFFLCVMLVFALAATPREASAETGQAGDLGLGGYFGLGGVTKFANGYNGAFAMGIQPTLMYFPIDNLAINFRFLWERYFYEVNSVDCNVDVYPFIFGARYYFPISSEFSAFAGAGLGGTAYKMDFPGTDTEGRFAIDLNGGIQFEVIPHLGIEGMFDILLPNIADRDPGEKVVARFMIFGGVVYYLPI